MSGSYTTTFFKADSEVQFERAKAKSNSYFSTEYQQKLYKEITIQNVVIVCLFIGA